MMSIKFILILVGSILTILAGLNVGSPIRLEWLGVGLFMLSFAF